MEGSIEVNKPEDIRINNSKKRNINVWSIHISLVFIIIGVVLYGVNVGLIY